MTAVSNTETRQLPVQAIQIVIACLGALLINLQLWNYATPPLIDWPNHLIRHKLQCGTPDVALISQYYEYAFRVVPNLTSDLLHQTSLACLNPELTQKVLIQFASFGVFAATMILHRAIWGSWAIWPVLSVYFTHHMAWSYGFENFVLAVPLAILLLAAWFWLYDRALVIRLGVIWPLAVALYVCHLYVFAFFMAALGLLELQRWIDHRKQGATLKDGALALAGIALIATLPALHLLSTINTGTGMSDSIHIFGSWNTRILVFLSPFGTFGNLGHTVETLRLAQANLAFVLLVPVIAWAAGFRITIDKRLLLPLIGLVLITLFVPASLFSVHYTHIRFPVMTAAVLIAATRIDFSPRAGWVFLLVLLSIFFARTNWVADRWAQHDAQVAELREAGRLLDQNDAVLMSNHLFTHTSILHAHTASYLFEDRGFYWASLFTGGNSLKPRGRYAEHDIVQGFPIDWSFLLEDVENEGPSLLPEEIEDWRSVYTHLIIIWNSALPAPETEKLGTRVHRGSFFDIVEVPRKD